MGIKVTELRIGNYVKDSVSGEVMVVDELGENVGAVLLNRDKYPLPDGWQMDYIPLTPEILEKSGFEQNRSHHAEYFIKTGIGNNSLMIKLGYQFKHEGRWWPEIKHVHQLQNLYHAITGQELNIKWI